MLFVSVGRRFVVEQVVPVAVFVRRVCSRGCVVLARHCIPGSVSWVKLSHGVVGVSVTGVLGLRALVLVAYR